jgi:hypothetical protein
MDQEKQQGETSEVVFGSDNEEPILKPNPKRFVLFPIKYPEV